MIRALAQNGAQSYWARMERGEVGPSDFEVMGHHFLMISNYPILPFSVQRVSLMLVTYHILVTESPKDVTCNTAEFESEKYDKSVLYHVH